jgi:acyl-CoA reductase-like NAD-dependent aldehyde dehydrogenase
MSILKFKTIDEVIERANNTNYGLAAGIVTKDLEKALNISSRLKAGMILLIIIYLDYITI